ncbi:RelA/SpoT domain-containing protein [Bradyrhizobium sp. UFLA05-153]
MNYDEFIRDGRSRYDLFAKMVVSILRSAIDAETRTFRVQQITSRARDPVSLRRKLTERGLLASNGIEEELKDLAGCRVIFYTNTDVDRFLNSRLVHENFVIDFDGSKIHHAVGKERSADQLYFGIHYLVSLTETRLALPEYAQFRGMRCEIQFQTILNHAWAETSHDIIYHPAPMRGFGTEHFADIKKRLERIMNQYLLPAGYEFQKVQHDYERLLAGKALIDRGTFEVLENAKDNNERYEQLSRIRKDLLPLYDDVPAITPELIRLAAVAIKAARDTPTIKIETEFGSFDGRTAEQVANEALQLIDNVRYVDIDLTFGTLCDLYITASSDEERKRILESVETLAKHDLNAWRQVGFGVQKVLYDAICGLPDPQKHALRPVITAVCRQFLDTDLQGTTWHFNSVSLERAAVPASTAYTDFRAGVLALLFDQYRTADSPVDKMQIEQALSTATRFPMDGGSDDLIAMVFDNTKEVIEFFLDRVNDESFEMLQHIEHQFLWLYRRSKEMAAGELGSGIPAKAQALVAAIECFRDRVNAIDKFVKFKTLVGYQSVFPLEWTGDGMDIEGAQKYRAGKITEYANSVTAENADEWFEVIEFCAAVKSNDAATFPSFGEFLKQVAARNPDVMVSYLTQHEAVVGNFIPGILAGFAESDRPQIALSFIDQWIDQGRHLHAVARYLQYATNTAEELVAKVGEQAIQQRDAIATIGVIVAIVARQLTSLVDVTFIPSIQRLTDMKDARWVNGVWYLPALRPFLEALAEEQCKVLTENLVLRDRVDHHDERVLSAIARRYPQLVLNFLKARLDREERGEGEGRYEAVPYHMVDLGKLLAQEPKQVVQAAQSWYSSVHLHGWTTTAEHLPRDYKRLRSRVARAR